MDPSLKLLIRLPRSGRSRGRGRSVGATAFVAGLPRPAYLAASLFGAVSLDALSGRGGTQALRRWLGEFSEGDQNNEDPEWWVRDSGYRLPFYSDLEKEAEGGADMMELPSWHVNASPWVAGALAAAALARAVWRRVRESGEAAPECCAEAETPCTQEKQLRKSPRLKSS